jgi:hypothetical protein
MSRPASRKRPAAVCLPCAIEFLRSTAPARMDRCRERESLGRVARRCVVHSNQPAESDTLACGFRRAVLLQDLRLSDRRRLPPRAQICAGQTSSAVVCRRHHHRRLGAGRQVLSGRGRSGFRRRNVELSGAGRHRAWPGLYRLNRYRDDSRAGAMPQWLAHRSAHRAVPSQRKAAGPDLRPAIDRSARRHRDFQLLRRRRAPDRSSRGRAARERREHLSSHGVLLQPWGGARSRWESRARSSCPVSTNRTTKRTSQSTISGCASTARARGLSAFRWAWPAISRTSRRSSLSLAPSWSRQAENDTPGTSRPTSGTVASV